MLPLLAAHLLPSPLLPDPHLLHSSQSKSILTILCLTAFALSITSSCTPMTLCLIPPSLGKRAPPVLSKLLWTWAPPQCKGRLPLYSRSKLVELQDKFDELERQRVFARPENLGITVEYLNPSFLVKKPAGGHRLVTAFADVARYRKPQPSLMPDVETTLRTITQWKFIIVTDLTSAFYQIPLAKKSMKYSGVATQFRGIHAYTRCAMCMPGTETALEELMCRVLSDCLVFR